ncbi:MAG: RNA-binding S4 domain-containing protein, partial [Chlorobi bacterium]|nr:RNA-binding S4 domain-containing protein [Chlorobiota bacterium]
MNTETNIRIDKWLWAVRIFKTRSQASNACKKGKILINGISVKSSRIIKTGEIIDVKTNPVVYKYKVKGLLGKRLGAKLVTEFIENITPKSELLKLERMKTTPFGIRGKGYGRPTKKERRTIDNLKNSLLGVMF